MCPLGQDPTAFALPASLTAGMARLPRSGDQRAEAEVLSTKKAGMPPSCPQEPKWLLSTSPVFLLLVYYHSLSSQVPFLDSQH